MDAETQHVARAVVGIALAKALEVVVASQVGPPAQEGHVRRVHHLQALVHHEVARGRTSPNSSSGGFKVQKS